jgi:hypothetical protein
MEIFKHIVAKHNNYWQKTIKELALVDVDIEKLLQITIKNLYHVFGKLSHIEHDILTKVVYKFSMDYPDEFVKADGRKEYHKPILPYKTCVKFLKIYNITQLFEFLSDLN